MTAKMLERLAAIMKAHGNWYLTGIVPQEFGRPKACVRCPDNEEGYQFLTLEWIEREDTFVIL